MLAHQTALMARQEKLKPVDEYLKQLRSQVRTLDEGADAVAGFLDRKIEKQKRKESSSARPSTPTGARNGRD